MATTNVAHWLVNLTQAAFADLGEGYGLAEGGGAMSLGMGVVSGRDWRRRNAPFVNQLISCCKRRPRLTALGRLGDVCAAWGWRHSVPRQY
jgi:hypothetical protein